MKKKTLLTLLVLLMGVTYSSAQIEIEKDTFTEYKADYDANWIELHFHVINNSSAGDTMFYWKVTQDPNCDFGYAICDLNLCYPENWDSAAFNMPVGLDTTFIVYFYPKGNSDGSCWIDIKLVSRSNSGNKAEAHFEATTRGVGIAELNFQPLKVYPNPANNEVVLETSLPNAYSVEILDITGKQVMFVENNFDGTSIDVSALEPGTYYIKAVGEQQYSAVFVKQ